MERCIQEVTDYWTCLCCRAVTRERETRSGTLQGERLVFGQETIGREPPFNNHNYSKAVKLRCKCYIVPL